MFRVSGILEQAIANRLFDLETVVLGGDSEMGFHCSCGAGCDGGCTACTEKG